ncbi:cytochrome P450, partial [Cyathus striatus]
GPPALPFIGNTHQLPLTDSYIKFNEWATKYGPVVYFRTFGREFVVISDMKVATDLFEGRSKLYATKPRLVMAGELVGKEKTCMIFAKYGTLLKECRKISYGWLNKKQVKNSWRIQEIGSYHLIASLLEDPTQFSKHIRTQAGSVILRLVYGIKCLPENDPNIALSEQVSDLTALAMRPGYWLCDSFPILAHIPSWFPGATFKRWAERTRQLTNEFICRPYYAVKADVINGSTTREPSWVSESIHDESGSILSGDKEHQLMVAAGSMYNGGIDTTVALIRTFILMMTRNPDIQKKAQAEIDSVVGTQRLPIMSDIDALPYLNCITKEVLRMTSVIPVMPHSLDEDDIYDGYLIPKGAWVMVNTWAIFHDPNNYRNPFEFNPERFSPSHGSAAELDPEVLCFGIGRRSCPGLNLGKSSLFFYMSHILFMFDIKPRQGCDPPPVLFDSGHIRAPSQFECEFIPRSPEKVRYIQQVVSLTADENM